MADFLVTVDDKAVLPSQVHSSNDDGVTWIKRDLGLMEVFSVKVLSDNNAVIGGRELIGPANEGQLKYTSDGGLNWQVCGGNWNASSGTIDSTFWILQLTKVNTTTIYALGHSSGANESIIMKSIDGGATFNIVYNHGATIVSALSFSSSTNGLFFELLSGDYYETTNGGSTWTPSAIGSQLGSGSNFFQSFSNNAFSGADSSTGEIHRWVGGPLISGAVNDSDIIDVHYFDQNSLYIVDTAGHIHYSSDGGNTYGAALNITGVVQSTWITTSLGYATKSTEVWKTVDGGANWSLVYTKAVGEGNFITGPRETTFDSYDGTSPILGCTNSNALNYDPAATQDDGSCTFAYILQDCAATAPDIITQHDFSAEVGKVVKVNGINVCYQVSYHTTAVGAIAITSVDSIANDCGSCSTEILGCTNLNAYNYDPSANTDDGSCLFAFKLTDSQGVETDIITETNLTSYIGQTIKVNGQAVCYEVSYSNTNVGAIAVLVNESYTDSATCELTLLPPKTGLELCLEEAKKKFSALQAKIIRKIKQGKQCTTEMQQLKALAVWEEILEHYQAPTTTPDPDCRINEGCLSPTQIKDICTKIDNLNIN